jgi:hypothetical protein
MARRPLQTFSLSFLDCMSCGFGAILLVFLILTSQIRQQSEELVTDLRGEAQRTDARLAGARLYLQEVRGVLEELDRKQARLGIQTGAAATAVAASARSAREAHRERLESGQRLDRMKDELSQLEEQREDLAQQAGEAANLRRVQGEGRRQYLSGLRMSGKRVLILVDASASMLAGDIVNVLRLRNQPPEVRRNAPKWRRAVDTVDWITAHLRSDGSFQLYTFGTRAQPVLPGSAGTWIPNADGRKVDEAVQVLRTHAPAGGTSLDAAFGAFGSLSPAPDSVFLLVDGLPTQGRRPRTGVVDGEERLDLYQSAMKRLRRGIPVNVILFPMQGDPDAATAYWLLARTSGGALISPSEDWP